VTLYAISDRRLHPQGSLLDQGSALIRAGVDWFQVREKDLPDRALLHCLRILCLESRRFGVSVLINGRPDLALAGGAAGVHLPSDGIPTLEARKLLPPPLLVVRSCHSAGEVRRAAEQGADAVVFGPVFATPSKAPYGEPQGLEGLREACRGTSIAVIGLGGITRDNARDVMAAGASGIAAIRLFASMKNPSSEVPSLRAAMEAPVQPVR
jgi:thiamine-phosphate pyrophosphorylase